MNPNLINHLVRNNISKPTMISRTTHAVLSIGKPIQPLLGSIGEEFTKVDYDPKMENEAPIRYYKMIQKKQILDDVAAQTELAKQFKDTKQTKLENNAKKDEKECTAAMESRKRTARPPENANSKLLQAVMALSDKSVNDLKLLSKKGSEMNLQQHKLKHLRRNSSILSGSSSRYNRRYKHRLHSHMFHNTIHTFSTQCYNNHPPRNQQMHASWAAKADDVAKESMNKALMPVNSSVRNLISVSSGYPVKEADPMYSWNHPPSPDDYEIDLARIIETVPQKSEVKDGRLRLMQKHSPWDNHLSALKNIDAAKIYCKDGRGGQAYLRTDDPNCVLDKPRKHDLTIPSAPKTPAEIDGHLRKCDSIETIRKAKRYGTSPETFANNKSVPKWEPVTRYVHVYGRD